MRSPAVVVTAEHSCCPIKVAAKDFGLGAACLRSILAIRCCSRRRQARPEGCKTSTRASRQAASCFRQNGSPSVACVASNRRCRRRCCTTPLSQGGVRSASSTPEAPGFLSFMLMSASIQERLAGHAQVFIYKSGVTKMEIISAKDAPHLPLTQNNIFPDCPVRKQGGLCEYMIRALIRGATCSCREANHVRKPTVTTQLYIQKSHKHRGRWPRSKMQKHSGYT